MNFQMSQSPAIQVQDDLKSRDLCAGVMWSCVLDGAKYRVESSGLFWTSKEKQQKKTLIHFARRELGESHSILWSHAEIRLQVTRQLVFQKGFCKNQITCELGQKSVGCCLGKNVATMRARWKDMESQQIRLSEEEVQRTGQEMLSMLDHGDKMTICQTAY